MPTASNFVLCFQSDNRRASSQQLHRVKVPEQPQSSDDLVKPLTTQFMLWYIFPITAATVIYIRSACARFGNIVLCCAITSELFCTLSTLMNNTSHRDIPSKHKIWEREEKPNPVYY